MNEPTHPRTSHLDDRIQASTRPLLVDFTADWCPPCHAISPILDDIASERADELDLVRLDVDANPETAARHGVHSMPTLVIFARGIERTRLIGAHPKRTIDRWLDEALDPTLGRVSSPPAVDRRQPQHQ